MSLLGVVTEVLTIPSYSYSLLFHFHKGDISYVVVSAISVFSSVIVRIGANHVRTPIPWETGTENAKFLFCDNEGIFLPFFSCGEKSLLFPSFSDFSQNLLSPSCFFRLAFMSFVVIFYFFYFFC